MTPTRSEPELGSTATDSLAEAEASGGKVEVRPLETQGELETCVLLQKRIWGIEYGDIVPASILKVSQRIGGVSIGAFGPRGDMVGFVYGLTGVRDGRLTHWSHMLGVLGDHRGEGIGKKLKLRQRAWLVERGVLEMRWTFDPLVSGNAHFNLNILGVGIHAYAPEMYGETGSGLHSFGTDRLIAHWDLLLPLPEEEPSRRAHVPPPDGEPVLASDASDAGIEEALDRDRPAAVRIEIPYDIVAVNRTDHARAMAWRSATRKAFQEAWSRGYRVAGFSRTRGRPTCHYLLIRKDRGDVQG
jgi:predicted GNAT superfamily acetyltransferase